MLRVFQEPYEAQNLDELHQRLSFRNDDDAACFWLYHDSGSELGVMFKGDDAYVHYFPGGGHPGFHPIGAIRERGTDVPFVADNHELTPVDRTMVVPCRIALSAIDQFFSSGAKPTAIEWESL